MASGMGCRWRLDEQKEVVLCLHSVHNVQHSPNESYYGMATDHISEVEIPVTSERPARLMAGIDSVLSVRVFLHNRGSPSTSDRPVGQLSIPVREMLDTCGPGMYQTWFLLDTPTHYGGMNRAHILERFRCALHGVSMELHTARICLTLLESSTEPTEWAKDDKDRATYYEPLLVSHQQHVQISQAYFDYIERTDASSAGRAASSKRNSSLTGTSASLETSTLKMKLEHLQQQQREEEVGQLQRELDQITEEANKRIEKGNSAIVKLKAELKQLRDVEAVELQREQAETEARMKALREEGEKLRQRVEMTKDTTAMDEDLQQLRQEVMVLTNQKDALMKMVQEIYGTAQTERVGVEQTPVQVEAARVLASMQGGERESRAEEMLLPDAHELLNGR
mmetsp:Transcript_25203/g.58693  ORF Transcript_25203/g.58693 Transcript_25203/m.58693 type:complete len:395 (-) Transcript_25203:239-1423(-)